METKFIRMTDNGSGGCDDGDKNDLSVEKPLAMEKRGPFIHLIDASGKNPSPT